VLVNVIVTVNGSPAKYEDCAGVTTTRTPESSSVVADIRTRTLLQIANKNQDTVEGKIPCDPLCENRLGNEHKLQLLNSSCLHVLPTYLTRVSTSTTMELGSNFAAKLEPFLLMSKSAKGAAAAKLIENATSAPGVFVFAELLELPNIREVRQPNARCSLWSTDGLY
jgi:hypothetical protein